MAPSLGEAKRAALANMKPPKDNLLWQFNLQEKLELQKQEIEKLKHLPQDMLSLQEKLESNTALQKDTIGRLAKSTSVVSLEKEHMAMAEEMDRILAKFGEIEETMKTYEDNTAQTNKTIFVLTEENEILKRRLNIFEAQLSLPVNEQSNSVPAKGPTSPGRQATAEEPGLRSQPNPDLRPSTSSDPMSATGGHKSLTCNSQSQPNVLPSFESTYNFSQYNFKAAASTARATSSSDLPTNIAPSGQTASSSQAPPSSPRNPRPSTRRVNQSRNLTEAPATDSPRRIARTYKTRIEDCVDASDSPQRLSQGNKTLIKYFEETSESIRHSILMTSETDERLSRDWMNGLADRELFKDLQKAAIGIAKNRGTKHIYWKDVEMAIWLPNLESGMYWAKKRQMELEREEYRAEQRAKNREALLRNINDESFAPTVKNRKRKL